MPAVYSAATKVTPNSTSENAVLGLYCITGNKAYLRQWGVSYMANTAGAGWGLVKLVRWTGNGSGSSTFTPVDLGNYGGNVSTPYSGWTSAPTSITGPLETYYLNDGLMGREYPIDSRIRLGVSEWLGIMVTPHVASGVDIGVFMEWEEG